MKRRKVDKSKLIRKKQKAAMPKHSMQQPEEDSNRFMGRQVAPYSAAHTRWLRKDSTMEKDGRPADD